MECGICGSFTHNTLDHKEDNNMCRHEITNGNKCLKCNQILAPKEPTIVINGKLLLESQALTLRVALELFAISLHNDGLGEDTVGKQISANYKARIYEIRHLMRV